MSTQTRANWRTEAACKDVDTNVFFVEQGQSHLGQEAKRVCAGCSVVAECLLFALSSGDQTEGIWGGTTPTERARMGSRRKDGPTARARKSTVEKLVARGAAPAEVAHQLGVSYRHALRLMRTHRIPTTSPVKLTASWRSDQQPIAHIIESTHDRGRLNGTNP